MSGLDLDLIQKKERKPGFELYILLLLKVKVVAGRCDSMSRRCSSLSGFIIGAIESAVKGISPVILKRVPLRNPFERGLA
ncbi:hypothetical protein DCAR_0100225 [Daucus carota subsp. sativus]|uniref:Uncharacterized protein n=1 Tax=Daucus carota subsp. sativus TaxID=79200 RepID=A0AAF0VZJ8_DAUCS|nr:hypothetical protein DCAR_0100220 [Daucus carota subsp. sativus]WOG81080.1 hypothetical protein DCAR_0100225 [Daucus carota subsp. sativus]